MSEEKTNLSEEELMERKRRAARKRRLAEKRRRARRNRLIAIILLVLLALAVLFFAVRFIKGRKAGTPASGDSAYTADDGGSSDNDAAVTGNDAETGADTGADSQSETPEAETSSEESAQSSEPAPEETAAPALNETVYVTTTVNIREQPNTDCAVLGQASGGDSFVRTSNDNGWSAVSYNGGTAYISSDYLTTEKPQRPVWDVASLDPTSYNFGYSRANRDERNIPTDWKYYEDRWGEFDVDWIGDTSQNVIYLTMDEGFGNDTTIPILNTLQEKGVPVTFFITKYFADERPDLVQAILDHGHQIGNHSCTHPDMTSLSVEEQTSQIMTLNNQIKDQFGYEMKAFRYPMGIYSAQSLGLVNNLGFKVTFWSYAYNDYDNDHQPDVGESLQAALDCLHPGAIYLLHASSTTNAAMLADFIDGARARGFEFGVYPIE